LKTEDSIVKINPAAPEPDVIERAAEVIAGGGIVSFPTTCLYGLGADAFNPEAVRRIFDIKQRPRTRPILVLIKNRASLDPLVTSVPACAHPIMEKFWPGKVTLIFNARQGVPADLTAGTGKIGVRIPAHKVARALSKAMGNPITGTSANFSGEKGYSQLSEFNIKIIKKLSLALDAGTLGGGTGSTIVDVTADPPAVLREGMVSAEDIYAVL
jgi:L-threonylcarbamoyladenylate synthase